MSLEGMRKSYLLAGLDESHVDLDPLVEFRRWFQAAQQADPPHWLEVNAMTLATADRQGRVSSRIVLLKSVEAEGFTFFTNYQSAKGQQIQANAHVSLCFYWPHLERQTRIDGMASRVGTETSDRYFASRPRGSQLGAWVSEQSQPVASRQELEAALQALEAKYGDGPIPRPPHWGGYLVRPDKIEFWQGRPNRLHDRIQYRRAADQSWSIHRLSP